MFDLKGKQGFISLEVIYPYWKTGWPTCKDLHVKKDLHVATYM